MMNVTALPVAPVSNRLPPFLFGTSVVAALLWGWFERDEFWYSADHGLGYAFGIMGLTLMGLLLLYPLRKHWRPMSGLLPIRYWFRMHMVFGVLGPVLILFHANFNQGSVNSSVALYSMLLVAGSGLVGRYVYLQIHRGLYGEAIRYADLLREYEHSGTGSALMEDEQLYRFKEQLDNNKGSMLVLVINLVRVRVKAARTTDRHDHLALVALARMARLRVFSRLFSWWHLFHLPIFFMMLITAAVHVVVVHMY